MKQDNQKSMIHSQTVENQLEKLEAKTTTNEKNKKGSTNEIQPVTTEDGLTQ
ncbi:hypothetical protein PP175_07760 [Aneurinibacillus sp. Ricciae_BoGa-3]|uniref:hypothetical protein n=1 Tax=Aneurinibacillus sp. Ricciae_BoGa-3 TaxID=3022697 RepID=UPI00234192C6|nr:hypothetical protein [Aneurinibacillus sp. Ricciae_BoGa-3]WCK55820.1 hypothetical protein PP175_07760 [Aneurinibacillus sp. Ricciae_BoGa-3]